MQVPRSGAGESAIRDRETLCRGREERLKLQNRQSAGRQRTGLVVTNIIYGWE
jgi:hypothetical protein